VSERRAGEKFPLVASSTHVFPGTLSIADTSSLTTVPAGISSLSNAYTGSTVLPWITCPTLRTRTSESSATLIGVPAATLIGTVTGAAFSEAFCNAGTPSVCCCVPTGGRGFSVCATLTPLHNPITNPVSPNTLRCIPKLTADRGHYLAPFARLLLAVAALRDQDHTTARNLLASLSREFPQNGLYQRELTRIRQ
jgi:hypothetical protein